MRTKFAHPFFLVACAFLLVSCQKEVDFSSGDYKTLGTSANELLAASPYPLLQIQISYMPGYQPEAESVSALVSFLDAHINKPAGIEVYQQPIAASDKSVLSLTDIVALERSVRSIFTTQNTIAVHILLTNGYYTSNQIFATSYWNTSYVIFGGNVDDNSGGQNQVSRQHLMSTLLEHEFGHLLGLVDQGSSMITNHRENGAHCSNQDCLMYYAVETSDVDASTTVPILDSNCSADLKANGGK